MTSLKPLILGIALVVGTAAVAQQTDVNTPNAGSAGTQDTAQPSGQTVDDP